MSEFIKRDASLEKPIKILVIAAHHDDIEFGVAGSVAKWINEGADVTYCIVTDGGAGQNIPGVKRADTIALRRKEQMAAAAVVGVEDVRFLDYPDGTLEPTLELRRDLTRIIREIRPQRVICQDPTTIFVGDGYINHPDHRAAGEAALYAVFPSSESRPIFPELLDEELEPHKVKELYLNLTMKPDVYVDISDFLERKLASLGCHVSQFTEDGKTVDGIVDMVRGWNVENGKRVGVGAAEFYRVMRFSSRHKEEDGESAEAES